MSRPTERQSNAIRQNLIARIGEGEFAALFPLFICGEIIESNAHIFVFNEFYALQVQALYSFDVIQAYAEVMECDVQSVSVLPIDFSDLPIGPSNKPKRSPGRPGRPRCVT